MTTERSDDGLDEAKVAELWASIGVRRRARVRRRRFLSAVGAVAAVAMLAAGLLPPRQRAPVATASLPVPPAVKGPLHLATGVMPETLSAPSGAAQRFALDDGSVVELAPGGRLDIRANTGSAFTAHLDGSATFDVMPAGPRRWSIVADLVIVDVIGTRFTITENRTSRAKVATEERVAVDHGIVLVRGDSVPGRLRRLVDGESIVVSSGPSLTDPSPPSTALPSVSATPPSPSHAAPSWHALASGGNYDAAYRQLGREGIAHESSGASVDDLLVLADVARLSAHGAEAVEPLSRVVNEHSTDARAPVAAFTLGRLELDTLAHPALAGSAFARAIALGLPEGLMEDAYARLVEADAKAGDFVAARAARDAYARRYPQGTRSSTIERWLSGASSR